MRALRILHVTPYWADAWAYGGIPRVVGAFAHELSRRGHDVTVCATDVKSRTERLPLETAADGIDLRLFRNRSNRLAYDWQCFTPAGLHSFLRDRAHEFDVAHLHACRNLPGAIAAHYLTRYGVPYVLAPNGTAPVIERRHALKHAFDFVAGRRMLRDAAAVLAVSESERQQLVGLGVPDAKIRIVPNPVDLDEFALDDAVIRRARGRARWAIADNPLVMFLGKITPRKRLDVVVQAFARVSPTARLVVAGNDMGGVDESKAMARRLNIDDRVQFPGLLTGSDRLDALAAADVVVYPGEDEIFGLVAFEALLCGTPVVVAGDSGCGEIVRSLGGGRVVAAGDAELLGAAVTEVLAGAGEARASAALAAEPVRARFGAGAVTATLERVYSEIDEVGNYEATSVSYLVPVKNGGAMLAQTIASIERQHISGASEIIVIDDRSTDESLPWLKQQEAAGRIRLLDGAGRGLSAAINLGLQVARFPVVCQVDQDVELLPGWTEHLVAALGGDSSLGAVQGHYTRDARAGWISRAMAIDVEQRYERLTDGATSHVCTGNTAFRAAALRQVGLLDESLGYGGDVDLSYRLAAAGWKLAHCQRARSFHRWREGLLGYCRQQYGFGYGRLDVVRKHPARAAGDSVAPVSMMAQPIVTGLAIVAATIASALALAGLSWKLAAAISLILFGALVAERGVAGIRAFWRFGDPAALLFPLLHMARNLSWVTAIAVWTLRRLRGQITTPSQSMQARPGQAPSTDPSGVATFIPAPTRTVGIIPVHNEAASIAAVVADFRASCPDLDLLVVDDGSTDGSGDLLSRLDVRLLQLPERMGIGSAMRAGLRYARRLGYDSAIRLDGDGQHSAADVERLLEPLRAGQADVSLGSRFLLAASSRSTPVRVAQRLLAMCLSSLTSRAVTDPTSGFCALGPRAIRLLAEHHPTGYPEPELRLFLSRNELAVVEVPVETRPRLGGRTSLTPSRLAAAGARVLLAMLIVPLRPGVGRPDGD